MICKLVIRLLFRKIFITWLGFVLVACGGSVPPTSTATFAPTLTPLQAQATVVLPTATPNPVTPTPLQLSLDWAGYTTYVVQAGDTLESLSAQGGSLPMLVSRYNRLTQAELTPGQALIIPQLPGYTNTLQSQPVVISRGLTNAPKVALTFDAGAGAEPTEDLLAALRTADVQVTFFLTGAWIEAHPELVQTMAIDGHEFANHTFSHPDLTTLDAAAIKQELVTTEAALTALLGPEVSIRPYARPPFGALNETVSTTFAEVGYIPIMWTLDSLDSVGEPKSPAFLLERVTTALPPEQLSGSIILLHVGSQATADALPEMLAWFEQNGYAVVPLSEVMEP